MSDKNDAPASVTPSPDAVRTGFTITPYKLEYVPSILAGMFVFGVFYVIWQLMHFEVPRGNKDALNIIFGAITGSLTTIVAFYFGSSKSAQSKDSALQEMAKNAANTGTGNGSSTS